ncbi:MAG: prepilin-type N-terminal cleavage/methylation domain-containing protein [Verrucomicrobiota bacterium]
MIFRSPRGTSSRAFTLVELLLVISIIALLAALYLPAAARAKAKAARANCVSNLRQLGLGFRMFADDNSGKFPMQIPVRYGGSADYIARGEAFRHFQAASNYLHVTKIIVCPSDRSTTAADWGMLQNSNVSYFVGLDARLGKPHHLLAGDRNIVKKNGGQSPVLSLTTNDVVEWTPDIHIENGNILFADGHVEQLDNERLQIAVRSHGRLSP